MGGSGKRELGQDVDKHVGGRSLDDGYSAFFDKIANVVITDVNVFGLGGGHSVLGEGDAVVIVLVGDSGTRDRSSEGRQELTEKHDILGRGRESHVFSLSCGEPNDVM
jgi:hypothetical protein